jgi:DNA repair exonuclease SbcCD ATPase subunit
MKLNELRNLLEQRKGQQKQIINDVKVAETSAKELKQSLLLHEQAKEIVREVGLKTQQQLQYHISDITSLALEAVFDNPYKLELEFVQRRNKTECDLYFVRDSNRIDPLSASGGGAVDVAAFALRIACWSLNNPHSRATIILDEPMKFVSEGLKDKASEMIKEVSKKLGIQIIMITHEPKFTVYADKTFEVSINKNGVSKVI